MDTVLQALKEAFAHSQEITNRYRIGLSSDYRGKIPEKYKDNIRIVYEEDFKKIMAIARLADEQQKKIDELEKKIRTLPSGYDYYYPLGGGEYFD